MSQFFVEIRINSRTGLGLDVEVLAGKYVVVKRVQPNCSVDHRNSKASLGLQICRGDRIDGIDGVAGPTALTKLVQNLNTKHVGFTATISNFLRQVVTGTFTRPTPLSLHLQPPFGIRVRSQFGGMHLGITCVTNGSVRDWNNEHPTEDVCPGDAVVAIDDTLSLASSMEEAIDFALDETKITFLRYNSKNELVRLPSPHLKSGGRPHVSEDKLVAPISLAGSRQGLKYVSRAVTCF